MAIILRHPPGLVKPPLGAQINTGHPLAKGLIGCWLMNGGGGNKTYDISGNNNNGTLTSTTWDSGQFGATLGFNGSSSNIIMPKPGPLGGDARSFVTWFKSSSTLTQVLISYGLWSSGQAFYFSSENNTLVLRVNGANKIYTAANLDDGKWHQAAITLPSSATVNDALIYLDGVLAAFSSSTNGTLALNTASTNPIYLGQYFNGGNNISGNLDITLLYNRQLSPSEIQQLYAQPFAFMQPRTLWLPTGAAPTGNTYGFAGIGGIQGTGLIGMAG